jgi:hypothetical protein
MISCARGVRTSRARAMIAMMVTPASATLIHSDSARRPVSAIRVAKAGCSAAA